MVSTTLVTPRALHVPPRAIGYVRVSTDEQFASGAGIAAQEAAIQAEAARRGWDLLAVVGEESGYSSATLDRAGLQKAMSHLDAGQADILVVAKLDRLSRSVAQGSQVLEHAQRKGCSVVALDFGLDTTTPAGEMVGNMMLSMARYERRLIGERTKAALAQKRLQGVRLGRPSRVPEEVVARIVQAASAGMSQRAIASLLNAEGVPTGQGGTQWRHSAVGAVLRSHGAQNVLEEVRRSTNLAD